MKDNNTKRSQRTPAEIIAETEAKLERLRMKEAKQQAQANPAVSALLDRKAEIQKDIREAKKVLGSGPQSATLGSTRSRHPSVRLRLPSRLPSVESKRSTPRSRPKWPRSWPLKKCLPRLDTHEGSWYNGPSLTHLFNL
jgi:hypothetical protein